VICGSGKSALGIEFLVRGAFMGAERDTHIHSALGREAHDLGAAPGLLRQEDHSRTGTLKTIEIEEVMKFAKVEHQLIDVEGAMQMLASISDPDNGRVRSNAW
jgi:hypothetical protein